ncbi:MAG: cyclase family protein [Candidatus Poribacteria bacterium]|nr:cyclase family protein [Candidatus Poribacteria bacterium]
MPTLIDLSQEFFHRAPVFPGHPPIQVFPFITHEERENAPHTSETASPVVNSIICSDHSSTHVDAFSHFSKDLRERSISTMPLEMFYTEGICLDLSHFPPKGLIEVADIQAALTKHRLEIQPKDTVLLHTDHYRRTFGTPAFTTDWPGISADVARWFGEQQITAFGVESLGPGIPGISNADVHRICGELGYTHYENLVNLHLLVGKGRFRFIGFPLKIRGGTGSPVRAVAVLE